MENAFIDIKILFLFRYMPLANDKTKGRDGT